MTFQVAQVNKALGSVHSIVHKGNRVVFDDEGLYIEDKKYGGTSMFGTRNHWQSIHNMSRSRPKHLSNMSTTYLKDVKIM